MAIYHLSGTIISRSQRRSSVAASAYRSASKLHDERQGLTHDYTKKQDVAQRSAGRAVAAFQSGEKDASVSLSESFFNQPLTKAEQQHYEQVLQQAAKQADAEKHKLRVFHTHANFSDFKRQFEQDNPEQAKAIQEAIHPRHETLVMEVEKHIALLEKAGGESRTPRTYQAELERYAAGIVKQPAVMGQLREQNPEVSAKIQQLSEQHARNRERGRGIER